MNTGAAAIARQVQRKIGAVVQVLHLHCPIGAGTAGNHCQRGGFARKRHPGGFDALDKIDSALMYLRMIEVVEMNGKLVAADAAQQVVRAHQTG